MNVRACVRAYKPLLEHSFQDQQDRLHRAYRCGVRTIGSSETIEKWVNRSNVLPVALRLSQRSRFLFSRAHNDSSIGILTLLTRFSVSVCLSFSLFLLLASILSCAQLLLFLIVPMILKASYV